MNASSFLIMAPMVLGSTHLVGFVVCYFGSLSSDVLLPTCSGVYILNSVLKEGPIFVRSHTSSVEKERRFA